MAEPNVHKTLRELYDEWKDCTACSLGVRRQEVGGSFVFGEGSIARPGGIMFIGEGPGREEEMLGRPFIGESGKLLRAMLDVSGLQNYYITNLVTCRSCSPVIDETTGLQKTFKQRGGPPLPLYKDESPGAVHMTACRQRLMEEIFMVDPILIVALGAEAASALAQRKVAITMERGQVFVASIPGATYTPVLTEKRRAWARVVNKELHLPVQQNEVEYLVMPVWHPAYVLRKKDDLGERGPMRQLAGDLKQAIQIYERTLLEGYGIEPSLKPIPDNLDMETT